MLSDLVTADELVSMAYAYRADALALRADGASVEADLALEIAEQRVTSAEVCRGLWSVCPN